MKPYEQNVATQIIEDFMLMANETVGKRILARENIRLFYRTHDNSGSGKSGKPSYASENIRDSGAESM